MTDSSDDGGRVRKRSANPEKILLDDFLDVNYEYAKTEGSDMTFSSDKEVYMLQVPKNFDIDSLLTSTLSLGGKTKFTSSSGEKFVIQPQQEEASPTLVLSDQVYKLPCQGRLVMEKAVKLKRQKNVEIPAKMKIPLPCKLKKRHPLLGAGYKTKVGLNDDVQLKLQEARENLKKYENYSLKKKKKADKRQAKEKELIFKLLGANINSNSCENDETTVFPVSIKKESNVNSALTNLTSANNQDSRNYEPKSKRRSKQLTTAEADNYEVSIDINDTYGWSAVENSLCQEPTGWLDESENEVMNKKKKKGSISREPTAGEEMNNEKEINLSEKNFEIKTKKIKKEKFSQEPTGWLNESENEVINKKKKKGRISREPTAGEDNENNTTKDKADDSMSTHIMDPRDFSSTQKSTSFEMPNEWDISTDELDKSNDEINYKMKKKHKNPSKVATHNADEQNEDTLNNYKKKDKKTKVLTTEIDDEFVTKPELCNENSLSKKTKRIKSENKKQSNETAAQNSSILEPATKVRGKKSHIEFPNSENRESSIGNEIGLDNGFELKAKKRRKDKLCQDTDKDEKISKALANMSHTLFSPVKENSFDLKAKKIKKEKLTQDTLLFNKDTDEAMNNEKEINLSEKNFEIKAKKIKKEKLSQDTARLDMNKDESINNILANVSQRLLSPVKENTVSNGEQHHNFFDKRQQGDSREEKLRSKKRKIDRTIIEGDDSVQNYPSAKKIKTERMSLGEPDLSIVKKEKPDTSRNGFDFEDILDTSMMKRVKKKKKIKTEAE